MSVDWAERIRKRNRAFLILGCLVVIVDLATFGLHLSDAPFIASWLWILYFIAVHLRWKADPKGGGAAVRKELVRQGTLFKHSWAWWWLPALLGIGLGQGLTGAVYLPFALGFSIWFWRIGEALIRLAND